MKKEYEPSATLKRYQAMLDLDKEYKALVRNHDNLKENFAKREKVYKDKIKELKEKLEVKQHPTVRLVPMNDKVSQIIAQYNTGRPPKLYPDEHTLQRIADMAMLCATEQEMAGCLGVSQSVFVEFKKNNPEVVQLIESSQNEGKLSLRRTQFRMSETNAQLAIFLGKQYLAQSEKSSSELNINHNVLKSLMELSDDSSEDYIDGEATIIDTRSSKVSKPISIHNDDDNNEDDNEQDD